MRIFLFILYVIIVISGIVLLNSGFWEMRQLKKKFEKLKKKIIHDLEYAKAADVHIKNTASGREAIKNGSQSEHAVESVFKESRLFFLENFQETLLETEREIDWTFTFLWPERYIKELGQLRKDTKEFINHIKDSYQ